MSIHEKFDDFDIALYHLVFIGKSIDNTFVAYSNILNKVSPEDERILFVSTSSLMLIQTVSFLEEFQHHIKSGDSDLNDFIMAVKKAVKPAVTQLRSWKGIEDFRNHVLAHNLRNRNEKKSVFEYGLGSYDIPQHGGELAILHQCIWMITQTFESTFRSKLEDFQKELEFSNHTAKENKYKSIEDTNAVVNRIRSEINTNILMIKNSNGKTT